MATYGTMISTQTIEVHNKLLPDHKTSRKRFQSMSLNKNAKNWTNGTNGSNGVSLLLISDDRNLTTRTTLTTHHSCHIRAKPLTTTGTAHIPELTVANSGQQRPTVPNSAPIVVMLEQLILRLGLSEAH